MIEIADLVKDTFRRLGLKIIAGDEGIHHTVGQRELNRPGLALAGFFELFQSERIQVIGNTELLFLNQMTESAREKILERLFAYPLPCVILTNRNTPPTQLTEIANRNAIPLLSTRLDTTELTFHLSHYLTDRFSPSESVHGTLVDVYGTGLLFTGRAGIGKSEIALDLVERGHRLVADDIVVITRKAPGILLGSGPEMLRHLLEIRGVGVIDIRQIFGVRAIRLQKRIETVVELTEWDGKEEYERIGLETVYKKILGIEIPSLRLPIYAGKNVTVIAETIALTLHLKVYGHNAAEELMNRQAVAMKQKRIISDYLRWDNE